MTKIFIAYQTFYTDKYSETHNIGIANAVVDVEFRIVDTDSIRLIEKSIEDKYLEDCPKPENPYYEHNPSAKVTIISLTVLR